MVCAWEYQTLAFPSQSPQNNKLPNRDWELSADGGEEERIGSIEVPQRKSPTTPRTARQLKTPGSDSDSIASSPHPPNRIPKEKSPRLVERKSPRSPAAEIQKKRPSRVSELESQLSQLKKELKAANDQLISSESCQRKIQEEAEEAKKELLAMSKLHEESQKQMLELSASEQNQFEEVREFPQDGDEARQSELEALRKQHSSDSIALASATDEVQKLKAQLEAVSQFEATESKHAESARAEIQGLRMELADTLSLVEKLKDELSKGKDSESQALDVLRRTQIQFETVNATVEMLQTDGLKAMEAYNSLSLELEQSKAQVRSLEEFVNQFQADLPNGGCKSLEYPSPAEKEGNEEMKLKPDQNSLRFEVLQLKSALEAAETKYQEECVQRTLQMRSAYEQLELTRSEADQKQLELEAELKKTKVQIEQLKTQLMNKEAHLQRLLEENKELNLKSHRNLPGEGEESQLAVDLKKSEADVVQLKEKLSDKELELLCITEENELLKRDINRKEAENMKTNEMAEAAKAGEREALTKLSYATEEADKSSRKAARASEQLDAAQAANSEMEAELRRLKVQADQWRKAAEAAASMLSPGNNGKYVERTVSLDSNYPMGSPYLEDPDDDSPKKKNGNMLKKIGVLWKKGQK